MNLIFFDTSYLHEALKPFTLTRTVAEIRVGICKIFEKWEQKFQLDSGEKQQSSFLTINYLSEKFPCGPGKENLFINGSLCPDDQLVKAIIGLKNGEGLTADQEILALRIHSRDAAERIIKSESLFKGETQAEGSTGKTGRFTHGNLSFASYPHAVTAIRNKWDIFDKNSDQIRSDYELLTKGRLSAPTDDPYTRIYHPENVFIEEGVRIRAALINAEEGPVYLGKNAVIHENAVIKGPFALCEGATINMGAKIREGTTVGPFSKVGGEVKNTVFFENSNKGHEGFVGNSVIGEWCNFGADTNTSNLKNNYSPVKLWNYATKAFEETGLQFCGLMMGDHSKCSINTMFNTGTVVGVNVNIFDPGFPPKFLPSFTWGGANHVTEYQIEKALYAASRMMSRRGLNFSDADKSILRYLYENRQNEL